MPIIGVRPAASLKAAPAAPSAALGRDLGVRFSEIIAEAFGIVMMMPKERSGPTAKPQLPSAGALQYGTLPSPPVENIPPSVNPLPLLSETFQ